MAQPHHHVDSLGFVVIDEIDGQTAKFVKRGQLNWGLLTIAYIAYANDDQVVQRRSRNAGLGVVTRPDFRRPRGKFSDLVQADGK
jgi:hypothetical protein